ncbi:MAG: hypothetical protein ACREUT_07720 [Steroidobacteraceae bacterium]
MTPNPYDPLKRDDLSRRERILLEFTAEVVHGTSDQLAEHWDIVQPLPSGDYDPMELSREDFQRFYSLFGISRQL